MRRRSSGTHCLSGQSSGAEIILSLGLPTVLLQLGPKLRASPRRAKRLPSPQLDRPWRG